jgi:hypothetical protein
MTIVQSRALEKGRRSASEHTFFRGMSLFVAAVVFVGFARTYYLGAFFDAKPLPAPVVHVHGLAFTCWIVLLVVQTSLAGAGRIRLHRRLGLIGLGLAPVMVILGVAVAIEMLRRFAPIPAVDSKSIFAVALSEVLGFAAPVFFAFRLRRQPPFHKRLMLIGTIAMTTAGFGRWPIHVLLHQPLPAMLAAFALLALLAGYDLVSTGRLHPATVWGCAWVVSIELCGFAVGGTVLWRTFAAYIARLPLRPA